MPLRAVPADLCTNVTERLIFLPHLCLAGIGCIFSEDLVGRRDSTFRRPMNVRACGEYRNEERPFTLPWHRGVMPGARHRDRGTAARAEIAVARDPEACCRGGEAGGLSSSSFHSSC